MVNHEQTLGVPRLHHRVYEYRPEVYPHSSGDLGAFSQIVWQRDDARRETHFLYPRSTAAQWLRSAIIKPPRNDPLDHATSFFGSFPLVHSAGSSLGEFCKSLRPSERWPPSTIFIRCSARSCRWFQGFSLDRDVLGLRSQGRSAVIIQNNAKQ